MRQPVIAGGRPGGQRVDQRCCLGRAPAGQQRLGCGDSQRVGIKGRVQAAVAGGLQAGQRDLDGVVELPQLHQRVAFGVG